MFDTNQDAEALAKDLQVSVKSLRKCWSTVFGKEAVRQRGKARSIASNQRRGLPEGQVRLCKCGAVCAPNRYECHACESAANKRYRSNMSPEARELHLAKQRGHNDRYYVLHAEELRAYARGYREEHHQETRSKEKSYYTRYPERLLIHNAKFRAKRYEVPFNLTVEYTKGCIPENGCCPITNQPFERGDGQVGPRSMTLDRIIPELGYVIGNVLIVSHLANTIKQNCTEPEVFRRVAEYVEFGRLPKCTPQRGFMTESYYAEHPERVMIKGARGRAKEHGVPFGITAKYIRSCFPEDGCCPITRQPFKHGDGKCGPQSMSLDRIIPELGYVPGNIAVISHLANTIKQNCTDPEVFRRIADYLERAQEPVLKKAG